MIHTSIDNIYWVYKTTQILVSYPMCRLAETVVLCGNRVSSLYLGEIQGWKPSPTNTVI